MTENGAAGETKAAMRKVLAMPADVSEDAVRESAAALLAPPQSQHAEFAIANALWVDVTFTIAPDFLRVCQEIYYATAETLSRPPP